MFLQICCLRLSNLIADTPTKALISQKLQSIGRNGKLHMKFEAFFYLKSPITCNYDLFYFFNEISVGTVPLKQLSFCMLVGSKRPNKYATVYTLFASD